MHHANENHNEIGNSFEEHEKQDDSQKPVLPVNASMMQ